MALITRSAGQEYDWQYEVISRIERDGGDPADPEIWERYCAEVAEDEQAAPYCSTCGGTNWIILSEYPTPDGEHTLARCIDCSAQ